MKCPTCKKETYIGYWYNDCTEATDGELAFTITCPEDGCNCELETIVGKGKMQQVEL